MAVSTPLDILATFPGWVTSFEPRVRQEQSTQTNGRVIVKDFGSPLWTLAASSKSLKPSELDKWRGILSSLVGTQQTFLGYALSRFYPVSYPNGSWPTGVSFSGVGALDTIGGDNKTIKVSGLPSGFAFSAGDMIQIGTTDLHVLREAATASAGTTGNFEVYPSLWPGVVTSTAVSVKKPHCLMAIVPGSVSSQADAANGRGVISFRAMEAR